jgi:hypothetical protein
MNRNLTRSFLVCATLVLVAVISRIINTQTHWYSFAPVVAISLFSGAILKQKGYAYLLPLAAYLLSDLFIQFFTDIPGFYGISQFFVYGAMALVVLWGTRMGKPKALKVFGYTLGGSFIFWVISNLGVYFTGMYGMDAQGFLTTYLMALPFYTVSGTPLFINAFLGDILFSGLLFGAYALIQHMAFTKKTAIN